MRQPIVGGYPDTLNYASTTPEYNCLMGGTLWSTTESNAYQVMPTAGKLKRLFVELSATQAVASASYTFTLMVDGVASTLTCAVTTGNSTASDVTHEVSVTAGQTVSLRSVATATDPTAATARWTLQFEGTTAGESICLGHGLTSGLASRVGAIQGCGLDAGDAETYVGTGGTFKKLYVQLAADAGTSPDAYTFTLRVASLVTTITCSIVANNTTGNDTTHTAVAVAGNNAFIDIDPISGPSVAPEAGWGLVFVSNIDGESLLCAGTAGDTLDNTNTTYSPFGFLGAAGSPLAWSTTEQFCLIQACYVSKFYVRMPGSPGTGNSYDFSINKDGGADSGITVHIHDTDTTGNDTTHSYYAADGDTISLKCVPTSTPSARAVGMGCVLYIDPNSVEPRVAYYPHILAH